MNPQMLNKSISSKLTTQKPVFKNILLEKWDERQQRLIKTQIVITITQDNQIMYFCNGRLLRIESIQEDFKVQQIFTNIEQVEYFQWQGEFEQKNKKIGKWIAKWNGNVLQDVGGYYSNGLKYGLWKEPIKNYWNKAQVYEVGDYINGKKRGAWMYIYNKKKFKGGQYNEQGQKNGKWRELSDGFHEKSQVIYDGEYTNGQKVGQWDIYFQDYYENKPKLIGGGLYSETGRGYKNGRWIELSNEFRRTSQITCNGQYKNGKKVGRWDIYWNKYGNNQKIGGGSYDESGDEVKINGWIEVSEGFTEGSEITYNGEYQNGKQIGRWDVLYSGKKIGGGLYDQNGDGHKTGKWIESSELFKARSQVTYRGEYENGKKVGRWDIFCCQDQIGGGYYDESGNGCKIGRWTELSDQYNNLSKVTYLGDYKNGTKVGRWDIKLNLQQEQQQIGGGQYDEEGIKFGQWVDLCDDFGYGYDQLNFIYTGEYKGGKKVGSWNMFKRGEKPMQYTVFGCGQYDEAGNDCKIGRWIELSNEFRNTSQFTYDGQYKNGKKVGRWDIQWHHQKSNKNIGGGLYDESGNECKIGRWIEISDEFDDFSQVTYHGDYRCGKKVGRWDIWYQKNYDNLKNEMIGGGSYDELGNEYKIGKWTELNHKFRDISQVTYIGEYKNNKKIGLWEIQYEAEKIGGGSYDEEGDMIKIGKWIELDDSFTDTFQTIYEGEFRRGQKIGIWIKKKRGEYDLDFRKVDVIKYDD